MTARECWKAAGLESIHDFMRDTPTPLVEAGHELRDADDGSSMGETKIVARRLLKQAAKEVAAANSGGIA